MNQIQAGHERQWNRPAADWYNIDQEIIVVELNADVTVGLSSSEAAFRLQQYGANEVTTGQKTSAWKIFAGQFKNILIVILIVAVVLSIILGHTIEAIAITAILLFAVVLGFLQEYRAEHALQALQHMA